LKNSPSSAGDAVAGPALTVDAVDLLENVLGEINANGANLHVNDPALVIHSEAITVWHLNAGAGVVHPIIFDRSSGLRLPLDVCFCPKARRQRNDANGMDRPLLPKSGRRP
jgi:hypothetical protein